MEVTLLGTGDTTGTPTVGCGCDVCEQARDPDDALREQLRDRGVEVGDRGVERTRFSVHVRNERTDETLLIDASPDFRTQFLREDLDAPDAAVISHVHFDHLDGLGNFYRLTRDMPVYAAGEVDPATGQSVAQSVRERYDYLDVIDVKARDPFESFRVAGLDVTLVPVDHPPLSCYGLVVEDPETGAKLSLSGDTSYEVPQASRDALAGADLLLVDGILPADRCDTHPAGGSHHDDEGVPMTYGSKHMTIEGAQRLSEELDAGELRIVHLSHYLPVETAFDVPLAVDGERFVL
ncbi:beta-lactamase domain protein [Halorhabdus utahensis DSM 12940]|uniref:Beta-lactamase domain protein n=1 Tax=Halorhabdus utahensis (strain DSM 12940 / JCM 11049 / AX-2) TaxID=519442 RepID=C7NUM3_HALUD|nr:MBL fold metallo-hydrolase [Halorhabdus utahensis]ACV12380.1 beta-lactamase domain protein [Halorhabdus utahensis DSM 12940]